MPTLHWTSSRIDALSFITVVPSNYHFYASSSSVEPFWLFYDLTAFNYTKGKWQWRKGYLFCFESYHFDKKMFLCICFFFSFWSEASQGLGFQGPNSQDPSIPGIRSQGPGSLVLILDYALEKQKDWKVYVKM